jgi:hypothetical protein
MNKKISSVQMVLGALSLLLISFNAQAVPSYARQTGLACAACHTIFPELTPFGRSFKLNGYTLTGLKGIEAQPTTSASGVKIGAVAPMAAMLQVNAVHTDAGNEYAFPNEFSLFFAGEISPKMGSFIQMTMAPPEGEPSFSMDNADIRYATHSGDTIWGITVNNSPTVQDLWNSTPVWGYPFTGGADVTQPLIADGLGQNIMGIGAYAQMANGLYAELSVYQPTQDMADPTGLSFGDTARIQESAPYARLAWETALSNGDALMIGAYGMQANIYDNSATTPTAGVNKYTDMTVDSQYEHHLKGGDLISVHGSYTNEKQDIGMAGGTSGTLNALRLDAGYHWGSHAEAILAYANNGGDFGDEEAITAQYSYLPWQNTKLTAQYIHPTKPSGSDTVLLQAWFMW